MATRPNLIWLLRTACSRRRKEAEAVSISSRRRKEAEAVNTADDEKTRSQWAGRSGPFPYAGVGALSWEIWRRGRNAAWLALGLLVGCAGYNLLMPAGPHPFGGRETVFTVLMVASLALVFAIFHCTEFRPGKDWHGFPYRWFVLPLPTWLLIACPMGWGLLSVELMWLAWSRLVFAPAGVTVPTFLGLILGAGMLSYQAVLWSLAGFRVTRIVMLSLAAMVFANLSFLFMMPDLAPRISQQAKIGVVIGLAAAAVAGAWFAVEQQRRGGGRGRGLLKGLLLRAGDALPQRRRSFKSAAAAQFWYEWRRAGWLLPACTAAALLFVFVPVSWRFRTDPEACWWFLGWALVLPLLLAAVIGKGFANADIWSTDLSLPGFLAVRPFTAGDLVVTRMKVAAASVGLAWALVLLFLGSWLPLWANTEDLHHFIADWFLLQGRMAVWAALLLLLAMPMALSWRCLVNGFWLGLSGNRKLVVAALLLNVAGLVLAIYALVSAAKHYQSQYLAAYVSWAGWGLLGAVLLKLWWAVFSWKRISAVRAARYAVLWASGTFLLVLLARLACPDIFWLKHLVLTAALLPLPLARLGLAPGALARNRHRP